MFKVIWRGTDMVVTVYAVRGREFLIWDDITDEYGHWRWADMAQFRPVTTDDMAEG